MRTAIFVGALLVVAGSVFFFNPGESTQYFRIRFGTNEPIEMLAGWTGNSLLLYRNGEHNNPERYDRSEPNTSESTNKNHFAIPPVEHRAATYTITSMSEHHEVEPDPRHSLMMSVTVNENGTSFKQYCDVELRDRREELKTTHFDGPLLAQVRTIDFEVVSPEFVVGDEPTDLHVQVGTFDKSLGCWTVVETGADEISNFPDGVHPTATVEFPNGNSDPVVKTFPLDQFC